MRKVWKILATFFGLGYFLVAPGTLASLAAVIIYKFFLQALSWPAYIGLVAAIFFLGVIASNNYSAELKEKDPRRVVIDEVCGQFLVLFRLPPSWLILVLSFFLFRLFDIIKPFPIRKAESLSKGWGIMVDDIIAAVYAAVIINFYLLFT